MLCIRFHRNPLPENPTSRVLLRTAFPAFHFHSHFLCRRSSLPPPPHNSPSEECDTIHQSGAKDNNGFVFLATFA
ncbi:hypothetical protein L596_006898 [Steinernema carpocapsae]|uniref:Uncharacterized protein n=1 Tax=Steinernema carpocapsae TaxID=34508 RepID=A0A4U5P802_STECR|nr:hypothetical protein L596_006898 [Steinernema carpocapsae]